MPEARDFTPRLGDDRLAQLFEQRRGRLRAVAYRMLGSLSDADDALQEVWLNLSRAEAATIENLDAWLTTVCGRVCLNILRSRKRRREDPYGVSLPDPIVQEMSTIGPEDEALLAESVGLALLVVIESLAPPERLAFVLHDMFAVSFEEIALILDRSPAAVRQLASRARRRVQGEANVPDADLSAQRHVVEAYFTAAREGNFDALVALLDPDVVLLADSGPEKPSLVLRGPDAVARSALAGARGAATLRPALVNGVPGAVVFLGDRTAAVLAFTVARGRIVEVDVLRDPVRLQRLNL